MALLISGFGTPRRGILMPSLAIVPASLVFRISHVAFWDFYILTLGSQKTQSPQGDMNFRSKNHCIFIATVGGRLFLGKKLISK